MKDPLIILLHPLTTIAKLLGPGGAKAVDPEYSCCLRKIDMMKAVNGWEFHNVAGFRLSLANS